MEKIILININKLRLFRNLSCIICDNNNICKFEFKFKNRIFNVTYSERIKCYKLHINFCDRCIYDTVYILPLIYYKIKFYIDNNIDTFNEKLLDNLIPIVEPKYIERYV